jgi:hypothetical protein
VFPQAHKDSVNAHFQAYNLTSIEQAPPKLSNTEQAQFIRTKAVPVKWQMSASPSQVLCEKWCKQEIVPIMHKKNFHLRSPGKEKFSMQRTFLVEDEDVAHFGLISCIVRLNL